MSHTLKMHFWQNGTLITHEHVFADVESAKEFASLITKPSLLKIYNDYNELVHQTKSNEFTLVYA